MKNKENFSRFYYGDFYSKIIIFISVIFLLFVSQWKLAIFMSFALVFSFLFSEYAYKRSVQKMRSYLQDATEHVGASESMPGFPFPSISVNQKGKITWYNSAMDKLMEGELLFQHNIRDFVKDFEVSALETETKPPIWKTEIKGKQFAVYSHKIKCENEEAALILVYFIDISLSEEIKKRYKKERFVALTVAFDNFEEVMQGLEDETRSNIQSAVDRSMASMAAETNGVLKKTDRDKYSVFLSHEALQSLIIKRFPILDSVREIQCGNIIAPTLSIGVGVHGKTFLESDIYSRNALDMALGRGGDQVVIKDKNAMQFIGGKTREVEKRTKVKARVVAFALRELIRQSENVIICGHKNADIDCVGAAMGIVAIARSLGKKAYIIYHNFDETAIKVVKKATEEYAYKDVFVKRSAIDDIMTSKTLLIIADTNSPSYMENPELIGLTEQIFLIDHHRRSSDFVKNPTLLYHEPYASSTCEMVTEMIPYLTSKNILLKVEAEALYAGIYLDTKCFAFKTGVRTLEAAAYLRRAGIDPITVKQFFKNNLETFTQRAALIQSAKIIQNHVAITTSDKMYSPSLVAQTADELLNIADVDASFVIAKNENYCIISGRSTGKMNVQVILEQLGGGGHFSVAGAQIKDAEPGDVEEKLLEIIDAYLNEK